MAKQKMIINEPIPFQGTEEEKKANFATHHFWADDGVEYRCCDCDCKPWHKAAFYPCGTENIPRQNVEYQQF